MRLEMEGTGTVQELEAQIERPPSVTLNDNHEPDYSQGSHYSRSNSRNRSHAPSRTCPYRSESERAEAAIHGNGVDHCQRSSGGQVPQSEDLAHGEAIVTYGTDFVK